MQVRQTLHPSCKYYSVCTCHQTVLRDSSRVFTVRIARAVCYECVYITQVVFNFQNINSAITATPKIRKRVFLIYQECELCS